MPSGYFIYLKYFQDKVWWENEQRPGKGIDMMARKSNAKPSRLRAPIAWTPLGVIIAAIGVGITFLSWRYPASTPSPNFYSQISKKDIGGGHEEKAAKMEPSASVGVEKKVPSLPKTVSRPEPEKKREPHRIRKMEAQETAFPSGISSGKPLDFQMTGGTEAEKNSIVMHLNQLKVRSATITIMKSELDESRNVYIDVAYTNNTRRSFSFNTPLENVVALVLSKIEQGRGQ